MFEIKTMPFKIKLIVFCILLLFVFILKFREGPEICRHTERGMDSKIKCEKYWFKILIVQMTLFISYDPRGIL